MDCATLRIQNFGPIYNGTDACPEKKISIRKFSVFIGDQGTGKSTIVKVISALTWLEKAFMRKVFSPRNFRTEDLRNLLRNQNIADSYFRKNTVIVFDGTAFEISYLNGEVGIKEKRNSRYICPKILYIPSERNILSVANEIYDDASSLPNMLGQLSREMSKANQKLGRRAKILYGDFALSYDRETHTNYVVRRNTVSQSKVKLSQASSGLQSISPLLLVSDFNESEVEESFLGKIKAMSNAMKSQMLLELGDSDLKEKLENFFSSGLSINMAQDDIEQLRYRFSKYVNTCFINIVEEPEQNLFPLSQVEVLKRLVEHGVKEGNRLIMSTHSPYILSAMNNFIFAEDKRRQLGRSLHIKGLSNKHFIDFDDVSAYMIQDGDVEWIIDSEYRGIDAMRIDGCSEEINRVFDALFESGE